MGKKEKFLQGLKGEMAGNTKGKWSVLFPAMAGMVLGDKYESGSCLVVTEGGENAILSLVGKTFFTGGVWQSAVRIDRGGKEKNRKGGCDLPVHRK